jgi:hypothetical protein
VGDDVSCLTAPQVAAAKQIMPDPDGPYFVLIQAAPPRVEQGK